MGEVIDLTDALAKTLPAIDQDSPLTKS